MKTLTERDALLKPKAKGTLNSKTPNPFELAYKELWDLLPAWKKKAFADENAANRMTDTHHKFIKDVTDRAEELFATKA